MTLYVNSIKKVMFMFADVIVRSNKLFPSDQCGRRCYKNKN